MKYQFGWIMLFLHAIVSAEMVDTFVFHSDAERIRGVALAKSLRCPQCQNQNLVESNSPIAYQLRLEVYEMINQGKTNEEIIQHMTERFGQFVNYNPPLTPQTGILWGLPLGLLGALGVGIWWRSRRKAT